MPARRPRAHVRANNMGLPHTCEPPRSPFRKELRHKRQSPHAPLRCARRTHHGAALVQVDLVVLVLGLRPHLVRIVPIDREGLSTRTVAHRATVSQLYSRPAGRRRSIVGGKGDVRCAHCTSRHLHGVHQPSASHRGADRGGPAGQHTRQNDAVLVQSRVCMSYVLRSFGGIRRLIRRRPESPDAKFRQAPLASSDACKLMRLAKGGSVRSPLGLAFRTKCRFVTVCYGALPIVWRRTPACEAPRGRPRPMSARRQAGWRAPFCQAGGRACQ